MFADERSVSMLSRRAFGALTGAGAAGAVLGGALPLGWPAADAAPVRAAARPAPLLTRRTGTLLWSGRARRMSGMNAYWLGLDDNVRDRSGAPSLPPHATVTAALAGLRTMGANLVRAHTVGISAGTPRSFMPAPGRVVPGNLDSADWAVYEAGRRGVLLMVLLTDMWNYFHGGKGVFVHWAYEQNPAGLVDVPAPAHLFDAHPAGKATRAEEQFFARTPGGLRVRALFKDYVARWLAHVNPYTGLAYRDDPTIAVLETGNELWSATAEWTADIAAFLRRSAPGKLVADGSAATGLAVADAPGLRCPDVDIVGAHYYAADAEWRPAPLMTAAAQLDRDVAAAAAAGKAFVVGEYPWTRSDVSQWWSLTERRPGVAADLGWTFAGGTEAHGGDVGSDDVAVHWPYLGTTEQQRAPGLARHISTVSGVALGAGAGSPPASSARNLLRSVAVATTADAGLFAAGGARLSRVAGVPGAAGAVLRATATGAWPYVHPADPATGAPATAGRAYTGVVAVRPDRTRGMSAQLSWFDAAGRWLGGSTGRYTACPAGAWTQLTVIATAPAGAAQVVVQANAADAQTPGATTDLTRLGVFAGTAVPTWVAP